MTRSIEKRVLDWKDPDAREANLKIEHLEKRLFNSYEPTAFRNSNFFSRLTNWIGQDGLSEDDRLELFKSVPNLFYVGQSEFDELSRSAYQKVFAKWLIDSINIPFNASNFSEELNDEISRTWFCPISDSFRINNFYHLNLIPNNADYRPDWRSLSALRCDPLHIRSHITDQGFTRLVLLEDFVGGGSQMQEALEFAHMFSDVLDILVIPLIICPNGVKACKNYQSRLNLTVEPVLSLQQECFVAEHSFPGEPLRMQKIRDISINTFPLVGNGMLPGDTDVNGYPKKPYHPLGWDQVGGLIVMYTNTPDNTIPLYHWTSEHWVPLFPRHSRV